MGLEFRRESQSKGGDFGIIKIKEKLLKAVRLDLITTRTGIDKKEFPGLSLRAL